MRDTAPDSSFLEKDQLIFEQLKQGHYDAISEAYHRYRADFLSWAKRYSGLPESVALDLYQDALIILFKNLADGKLQTIQSTLVAYLIGIGKNLALKKHSLRAKEVYLDEYEEENLGTIELNILAFQEETLKESLIRDSFQQLSDICRQIIILFYYRGLSMNQICKQMNYKNENATKTAKHKCMNQFRKMVRASI